MVPPGRPAAPRALYEAGRARAGADAGRLERTFGRLGIARLAVFLAGAAVAVASATTAGRVSPAWVLPPLVLFLVLVVWHERVARRRDRARRSLAWAERGLARLDHRWMAGGDDGIRFRDDAHLYTSDLEIFGPGSLFQLLSTCRTETGAARLAAWLRAAAPPAEVVARQAAAREIATRDDLRHDLAVIGPEVQAGLDSRAVRAWVAGAPVAFPAWAAGGALAAAAANVAALAGWGFGWWLGIVPTVTILASSAVAAGLRSRVTAVLRAADAPERDLVLLAVLLDRVAGERFQAPWLAAIGERLRRSGAAPGAEVRRLARLVDLVDARRNQLFAPIAGVLVLGTQLAIRIEAWRRRVGPAVVEWLDAVGDLEAIVALGTFAFEHPEDGWPALVEGPARFAARGLAHPLLDETRVVRNDLLLEPPCRLIVVSGSNMSGKSTLLKAIGVNLVLAQAGAPVRALALETSPFLVGASLVLRDSLLEGRSRFYAEIVRLRDIVAAAAGDRPVLFLLDELLSGTNSHDRAIGADGVLRGLLRRGAAGLVTTHDLALTRIADALGEQAANSHLEDRLEGGQLVFDYRLKPGVVARSNALELMRSVGLDAP